jgi:hypothetical protein
VHPRSGNGDRDIFAFLLNGSEVLRAPRGFLAGFAPQNNQE